MAEHRHVGRRSGTERAGWRYAPRRLAAAGPRLLDGGGALLAPHARDCPLRPPRRAALLIERCLFTTDGWAEAEDALRTAEALARTDDERGAAACERGYLATSATLSGRRDRADEARAALGRSAALLAPGAAGAAAAGLPARAGRREPRGDPPAARAAYRRAHAGAVAGGDALLSSFTWRHLAGLAARDGDLAEARHGFASRPAHPGGARLPRRDRPGAGLAGRGDAEPEAARLRAEARRLFRLLGGVPVWLAAELEPDAG